MQTICIGMLWCQKMIQIMGAGISIGSGNKICNIAVLHIKLCNIWFLVHALLVHTSRMCRFDTVRLYSRFCINGVGIDTKMCWVRSFPAEYLIVSNLIFSKCVWVACWQMHLSALIFELNLPNMLAPIDCLFYILNCNFVIVWLTSMPVTRPQKWSD